MGGHPHVSIVVAEFLEVDYPSTYKAVIGRLTPKALKAITLIYDLMIKFPTPEGAGHVYQYDLRKCCNQSLRMVAKERRLPHIMLIKL